MSCDNRTFNNAKSFLFLIKKYLGETAGADGLVELVESVQGGVGRGRGGIVPQGPVLHVRDDGGHLVLLNGVVCFFNFPRTSVFYFGFRLSSFLK